MLAERLHQPETAFGIEAERVARHHAPVAEMQPDGFGLGDEIADGQHQAFVDQHAVAGAFGAERVGAEGVGRNDRMQADHRSQRAVEVVTVIARARLIGWRHSPFGQRNHPESPFNKISRNRSKPRLSSRGKIENGIREPPRRRSQLIAAGAALELKITGRGYGGIALRQTTCPLFLLTS